jgi:hypothetical protein
MCYEQVAYVGGPMAVAQVISVFALPHIQGWCANASYRLHVTRRQSELI